MGDDFSELSRQLNQDLETAFPGTFRRFPLEDYSEVLSRRPHGSGYRDPGNDVRRFCSAIRSHGGDDLLGFYHRSLLIHLAATDDINYSRFPESLRDDYRLEFERVVSEVNLHSPKWYSWDEDLFCKDMGICTGTMLPAGCLKAEIHSGIQRKAFLRIKPNELSKIVRIFFKARQLYPFYEIHLDIRYKDKLNPYGWTKALSKVAIALEKDTSIKGIIGASWFFDPAAINLSPRLSYLKEVIENAGGLLFKYKSDPRTEELATQTSKTRLDSFHNGTYKPTSYIFVWLRSDVLTWLKNI